MMLTKNSEIMVQRLTQNLFRFIYYDMSTKFSFKGPMAPVFTPFNKNKKIKFEVIPEYAKYLNSNGIKGILVNGTTGEGVSQTQNERKEVLEAWVKACEPWGQTIMVQVGGTNLEEVKSLARHAEELGVSAVLSLPDLFFKPSTVADLVRYLKIVSSAAPNTPLFYYHIPGFTGINLNMKSLLEKANEIPNFAGIKFTDNDLVMGTSCIARDLDHLSVFLGCDSLLLPALVQGFDSAIGTTINMFPSHNTSIFEYFKEGNFEKAKEIQEDLNEKIEKIIKQGSWVSSMKAAMRKLTPIDVGPVRDPLIDINVNLD